MTRKRAALIMISDGEDHEGAEAAAEEAAKLGIKIITIGVGTEKEAQFTKTKQSVVEGFKSNNEAVITKLKA
jgi:Ca-activated chloride channel family protein